MNTSLTNPTAKEKTEATTIFYEPRFSVERSENETVVIVELPGVSKDDLNLSVEKRELYLEGKVSNGRPDSWKVLHRESLDRTYRLRLRLGDQVDPEAIEASLADGVLRLTIPKSEAAKPRKIRVK